MRGNVSPYLDEIDPSALGLLGAGRLAKTSAYTVVAADRGYTIDCTSGTFSLSFDPAATLGSGWHVAIYNSGSGVVTLDPNGAETIRTPAGTATTLALSQGQGVVIACDAAGLLVTASTGLKATGAAASGTDNAAVRMDGTTGGTQNSGVIIDDSNNVTGVFGLSAATCALSGTLSVVGISTLQRIFIGTPTDDTVSKVQIDAGSGSFQAPPTGTALSMGAADAAFARVVGTAFGNTGIVFSGRAASGTRAVPAASAAELALFALTGFGHDGTSFPSSSNALYEMRAASLWSGANRETYHRWTATANGATASAQVARLDNTTGFTMASGLGINFGQDTLSYYDEGAWTPTVRGLGTAGSHTYVRQVGRYVRIGKRVHADFAIHLSAKDAAMAGNVQISGLPFAVKNLTNHYASLCLGFADNIAFTNQLVGYAGAAASVIDLIDSARTSGGFGAAIQPAAIGSGLFLMGTISYEVD